jgi:MFS family permease
VAEDKADMSISNQSQRNRLLGVLFVGVLMGALDIAIVGPALPAIQRAFGASERALSWIFAIYVLFNLIGTPLMAKLSDRFGRRAIYILDIAIFAFGSLLVAAAPTYAVLLAGRAIQGLGAGGIFPVASAVIGDTFPAERRGAALGLIGAVFGVAFLVGPVVGGVLLLYGWPLLFVINLPIAALVIALAWRLLPAGRPAAPRPFDWGGMLTLGALLGALAAGLTQLDSHRLGASLRAPDVWPFFLAAALLLPIFLMVERRAADPVLRLGLFRSRQVRLASALAFGAGVSEASVVFVPTMLVLAFGVSASTASFMLLPVVLAMAVGAPVSGWMLDRFGSRSVVVGGAGLIAVGLGLAALLPASVAGFYSAATLFGVGLSALLGASLRYIMLNETGPAERAAAQGALTVFTNIGQLIGGVLVGAIAASAGGGLAGYQAAFLAVAALMLALTLVALGLKGRAAELAAPGRAGAQPARS